MVQGDEITVTQILQLAVSKAGIANLTKDETSMLIHFEYRKDAAVDPGKNSRSQT